MYIFEDHKIDDLKIREGVIVAIVSTASSGLIDCEVVRICCVQILLGAVDQKKELIYRKCGSPSDRRPGTQYEE